MSARGSLAAFWAVMYFLSSASACAQFGVVAPSGGGRNVGIQYPWRFAIMSDTHTGWGYGVCGGVSNTTPLRACVDTLNTLGVDFAILNGDWGGGGPAWINHQKQIDSLYAAFLSRTRFPVFPVLGNHEAHRDDSLAFGGNPYAQAIARFPGYFQGKNYYYKDHKNVRFIALQNNVNYDTWSEDDYRINNPAGYAAPGGVPGMDYDGIHSPSGSERTWLRTALETRPYGHWLVIGAHRGVFGSDLNHTMRHNYNASRGVRYMKQISGALEDGERALCLQGDQHLPVWFTHAISDSVMANGAGKGVHYLTVASGAGVRTGDSTEVFGGVGLMSFVYHDTLGADRNRGRTRGLWAESLTDAQDAGLPCQFTWALATVFGDMMLVEVFRTWTAADAGTPGYAGAGRHSRITWHTLYRDASKATGVPAPGSPPVADTTPPATVSDLNLTLPTIASLTAQWTAPGDDNSTGTATQYDVKWSTSPVSVQGYIDVVGNGSFTPASSANLKGNYAQAIGAGGGSYAPAAAAALCITETEPEMHFISGGTNPLTADYAACLSAICGATFQFHSTNGTFKYVSKNIAPSAFNLGSFGAPTATGTLAGNLASRTFEFGTVYANLSTSTTTARPGGTLSASGWHVEWTNPGQPNAPGRFPKQGGIYWGNLTVSAIDSLKTWDTLVLNDANINGPTDGNTAIPSSPAERIASLRRVATRPMKIGISVNGFDIFVSGSLPRQPSLYWPMQVRMFHKANALGAWVLASDGISPLENTFAGVGTVRYVNFTNVAFRQWFAGQIDSVAHADGLDFLFIDQLESSLASEKAASPSTNWPSDQAWTAAWAAILADIQAGLPAPTYAVGEPVPAVAGTTQYFTIAGLSPQRRIFARIRTVDDASNWSGWSATDTDTALAVGTLSPEYAQFTAYCDTVFSTADEPLIKDTFGSTPVFVPVGDWVYPSRNSASVAFETNLPAKCRVEYGTTASYGSTTAPPDRHYYHHLHHLTGLAASTTYHYRLVATDDSGVTIYSADRTLTTGAFGSAIEIPGALSGPPYECGTTGATYLLTQNITVNGRGVFISANNVTVDLNGYTISYDNGTPVGSGLESATSSSGVHFFRYNAGTQGTLVRILNGKIVQGANNGAGSLGIGFNPVAIYEGKVEVAGIRAEYRGDDITGILNQWGTLHAHHNDIADGGTITTNRSQGIKAIYTHTTGSVAGEGVHHNLVRRCRHQGIMNYPADTGSSGFTDNEVWMDSWATNAYGLGPTTNVSRNKVFGTGYHAVGTGFLDHLTMQVTDNFIFMQGEEPTLRDDEYGLDASVIGVRLSQYDGATFNYANYLYSGNTIIVKGRDGTLSVRGVQMSSSPYITNCRISGNLVKCEIQDLETRGACVTAQGTNNQNSPGELPVFYEDNTFLTNDVFVRFGDQYACGGNHRFVNNTFTKFGSLASFKPIRIGYYNLNSYGNRFIDSNLGAGVSLSNVSVEGNPGGVRDYADGHSLWIEARGVGGTPLAATPVTAYDSAGLSYTATTNGSGVARIELINTFYQAGAGATSITTTSRTNHDVRVSGYQPHVFSSGEFAIANNSGSPLVVQFAP